MKVEKTKDEVRIVLDAREAYLLHRALERASYVDTPAHEQNDILSFCARALEQLEKGR